MSLSSSSCKRDTLAFNVDIFTAIDGYTVTFNPGVLEMETYDWDFGDGHTSNKANPVHTYAMDGTYTVTLTVTDKDAKGTATEEILLTKDPDIKVDIFTTIDGYTVTFNLGALEMETYDWDFGDGHTSNEANPVHTYAMDGTYTVTLTVTDKDAKGTATEEILLTKDPDIKVDIFTTIDGYTVTFNLGALEMETYDWDFGDGHTSNEANPVHTYAMDGTYTVTLTVTDTDAKGTATEEILLTKDSMKTSFYGDWESGQVTGSGNHNWSSKQVVDADRISLINDGNARQGNNYVRVEVRHGDNPLNCCPGTERAEVYGMQDEDNNPIYENLESGIQRYTFSVKFDESWQTIVDA